VHREVPRAGTFGALAVLRGAREHEGVLLRLERLVDLPHGAADLVRPLVLLHRQVPHVLVHLLALCTEVPQHGLQVRAFELQALDVLLGIGLALDLLVQPAGDGLLLLDLLCDLLALGGHAVGLRLEQLDAVVPGHDVAAQLLGLALDPLGCPPELQQPLVLRLEPLQALLPRRVVLLQALYLVAKALDPLLVDLPQPGLVFRVVALAIQIMDVVLVQGPEKVVVALIPVDAPGEDLALRVRHDQLQRDADRGDEPVQDREQLGPRVRPADRLQLRTVHLYGVLEALHDRRNLVLHLALHLQGRIDLRDQEAEYIEEFVPRRVPQQLVV